MAIFPLLLVVPVSSTADVDELPPCRVKQPAEVQVPTSAPWESVPAAGAQPEGLWPLEQHEQHDHTEAFGPLPDSPTGGLTAQDRSHDQQQRDTIESQREPGGVAKKLSPLQQVQTQVCHPEMQWWPCLVAGTACCVDMAGHAAALSTATR